MLKKSIIAGVGIILFIIVYNLTGSWKLSLAITGIIAIYLIWIIGIELGLGKGTSKQKNEADRHEHISRTENNPTLR